MAFTITKPAQAVEGFDGLLYGEPGTGKTSTLDDPLFKVLLIDLEGGSAVLSEAENVDRIDVPEEAKKATAEARAKNPQAPAVLEYEIIMEIYKALESGESELSGYDLYAIDSMTQFEQYVKDYVALKYAPKRAREIQGKFGAKSDWGDLKDLITRTVFAFHNLTKRGEKSIHLMWIAHIADKKENIPGTDDVRVVGKKVALQGGNTADVVMSKVDGLFFMFNKDVTNPKTKEVDTWRGVATKTLGNVPCKVRRSKKLEPLPTYIKDPVWSEIFAQLGYEKKNVK